MTSDPIPFPPADYTLAIPASNDALNEEITTLAGHINAATYRFLKLLAVQIERRAWSDGGGTRSPAHWLNYRCGITLGTAREKVRVAGRLAELPRIDQAFKSGALSYSKVRAMTRVATPENEEFLLQIARYGTASHLERLVRKYEWVERIHSREKANAIQEARSLTWHYDDDGMLVIEGRLPPEEGARVIEAINAIVGSPLPPETGSRGQKRFRGDVHCYLESGPMLAPHTVRRLACDAGLVPLLEDGRGQLLSIGRKSRTGPRLVIERENERLGLAIDEKTAVSWWCGEEMDYHDAVEALWDHTHSTA